LGDTTIRVIGSEPDNPDDPEPGLPRIGRSTLSDQVAGIVESKILGGSFPPGSRLPSEFELTESFGVSRTVIRDALRVLVARGLVEVRRGTGTIVKPSSVDAYSSAVATMLLRSNLTIGDVFAARAALEGQLALIAAANHTSAHIDRVRIAFERFEQAVKESRDVEAIVSGHVQFHAELVRATNLPALEILLGPIQQMMLATSVAARGVDPRDPRAWRVPVHLKLLEAVESRDPDAVAAASAKHWLTPLRGKSYRDVRHMRLGEMAMSPRELMAVQTGTDASRD
jgi:DNA-binding FadR family transcriptional regulator